jgi:hypothetical protein
VSEPSFRPTLTNLEDRVTPAAYWATHWWTLEHQQLAPATQEVASPPDTADSTDAVDGSGTDSQPYWATHWWTLDHATTPDAVVYGYTTDAAPAADPAPAAPQPAAVTPQPAAVTPQPAAVVPPAAPSIGDRVVSFAQSHVGQVVTAPDAVECAALVSSALRSAGAQTQAAFGSYGPFADHYVWGTLVYQASQVDGYGNAGQLSDVRPGDVIQLDRYNQAGPDGWATAYHHSAIIESVNPATGQVNVLQQNWNGDQTTERGTLNLSEMTSGVVSVYRPVSAF